MTVELVRSIELNGTTYILPEGTEIVAKFQALDGKVYDTPGEADEANGRKKLDDIISQVVTGYDYDVDLDVLIANRAEIIAILEKYP